jgi:hypothetical protein
MYLQKACNIAHIHTAYQPKNRINIRYILPPSCGLIDPRWGNSMFYGNGVKEKDRGEQERETRASDIHKGKTRPGGLMVTLGPKSTAAGYEGIVVN